MAPTPVPVPSDVKPGESLVIVDGVAEQVSVTPQPDNDRLTVQGEGWDMGLDGLSPTGMPLKLGPGGMLVLEAEGEVRALGSGFQPGSTVDVFMNPPTAAPQVSAAGSWWQRTALRASNGTFIGAVPVNADGSFVGTVSLPESIGPGDHVLQAVGFSARGQTRALNLGVRVEPSLVLTTGRRTPAGDKDRIRTRGFSTGLEAGTRLIPYISYAGQSGFSQGKASITVKADGRFTWTRLIRKDKRLTAYVTYRDLPSNKVIWTRVR